MVARIPGPKTPPKHGASAPVTPPKHGSMALAVRPIVVLPPARVVLPTESPHAPNRKQAPGAKTKAVAMLLNRPRASSSRAEEVMEAQLSVQPKAVVCRTLIYVGCPCGGMTIISSIMIDAGHKMGVFITF